MEWLWGLGTLAFVVLVALAIRRQRVEQRMQEDAWDESEAAGFDAVAAYEALTADETDADTLWCSDEED